MSNSGTKPVMATAEETLAWPPTRPLFTWVWPLIARCSDARRHGREVGIDDMLQLHPAEAVCGDYQTRFLPRWRRAAEQGQSMSRVLVQCFAPDLVVGLVTKVLADAGIVGSPLLLRLQITWVTEYVQTGTGQLWQGYMLSVALMGLALATSLLQNTSVHFTSRAFCQMRTCVMMTLFEKAASLPSSHGHTGRVMQLHGTDVGQFVEAASYAMATFTIVPILVGATVALYFLIGNAAFVGFAVAVLMVPLLMAAAKINGNERAFAALDADKRVQRVNELVQGIRIVKFMGWERPFAKLTDSARLKELAHFRLMHIWRVVMVVVLTYGPQVMAFATFAAAYGLGNSMSAQNVFPAFAMLAVMRTPFAVMPFAVGRMMELRVAMRRIDAFLAVPSQKAYLRQIPGDEMDRVSGDSRYALWAPKLTIEIPVGGAAGDGPPTTLMDVSNLGIPAGKLTIVVGATASGKSLLLTALAGENNVTENSSVLVSGSMAYVPQEAWIMNDTLKQNILMAEPYDEQRYVATLLACQLKSDLEQLPDGDATEIGERGVNLSGGQKQRVALARAVYSGRDIVLMDDPLSAVDPQVCGALFHQCIRRAMSERTRVLVTHQTHFLPWSDRIVLVAGLRVQFNGTYEEFVQRRDLHGLLAEDLRGGPLGDPAKDIPAEEIDATPQQDPWKVPGAGSRGPAQTLMTGEGTAAQDGTHGSDNIYWWYNGMAGWGLVLAMYFLFASWRVASGLSDYMVTWWATRTAPFNTHVLTQVEYLYWFGVLIAVTGILVTLRAVPYVYSSIAASRNIHSAVVDRLLTAPMSFYDTTPVGRIVNRVGKDVETVDVGVPDGLSVIYNQSMIVLGIWVVQAVAVWFMPLVYVGVLALFALTFRSYAVANHDVKALDSVMRSPVVAVMNEALGGLATLRAYGMIDAYRMKHAARIELMARTTYSVRALQRWLGLRIEAVSSLLIAALGIVAIAMLQNMSHSSREAQLPSLSLALTYVVFLAQSVTLVVTSLAQLMANFSSVERVREYMLTLPQERVTEYANGPVQLDENGVAVVAPAPPQGWPARGGILFDHVYVRYRPGLELVLHDVSFHVLPGEKVGIVGRTGSGKSTIMLTLFRMLEVEKSVCPDAPSRILIDGVDISHVNLADLRRQVTIIPQDPLLFQGTVRANLDPFGEHSDAAVEEALRKSSMLSRVLNEAGGINCVVADRGSNFSGGERQLLCLARALLRRCRILLLDEATASIDPKHDRIVQETIRREFADRTVLTIAHRLGTIIDSDKILLLQGGRVREFDPPHVLLETAAGAFAGMVRELGSEEEQRLRRVAAAAYAARSPFPSAAE